jgi:O-antigen/teichoic acid export membrane protein
MILNVGGFVFHAIASRRLGVADYGALYALISLYALAAIPSTLFTPVVAKYSAEFRALHDDAHVRGLAMLIGRALGIIGGAYVLIGIVLAPQLAAFLHVATWEIPAVGFMVAIGLLSSALRGIGQGTHDFVGYAWSMIAEGVGKVVALLVFAIGGLTVLGGVSGVLVGLCAGLVVMAFPLIKRYARVAAAPIHLDWTRIWATTAGAAALTITTAIIGYADVVLVKHFFQPHDAGLYSAASLGGKILLYFMGFVPAVLLPHATDRHARGEQTRETIYYALGFIILAGVIGVIAYRFFGLFLLHALVGHSFDAALPLLIGYAGAMAILAATTSLASYGIATHRNGFATPLLLGAVATLGAIALSHATLSIVVTELIAGNAVMLALVGAAIGWQGIRKPA